MRKGQATLHYFAFALGYVNAHYSVFTAHLMSSNLTAHPL